MKNNLERINKAKDTFYKVFMARGPFSEYVNGVGITARYIAETATEGNWNESSWEETKKRLRENGENSEEFVIHVFLRMSLPSELKFPKTWRGFRVYSMVVGEIVAQ